MKKIFKPWIIAIVVNALVFAIVVAVSNVTDEAVDKSRENDSNVVNTELIVAYPDNDNEDKYNIDVYFHANKLGSVKPGEYLVKVVEFSNDDIYGNSNLEFRNASNPLQSANVYMSTMSYDGTTRYILDGSEDKPKCVRVELCKASKTFYNDDYKEVSYTQMNQEKVAERMDMSGFDYIYTQALGDLKKGQDDQVGKVASISIDGKDDYMHNEQFLSNSKVVIKYHSMPDEDTSLKTYKEYAVR